MYFNLTGGHLPRYNIPKTILSISPTSLLLLQLSKDYTNNFLQSLISNNFPKITSLSSLFPVYYPNDDILS